MAIAIVLRAGESIGNTATVDFEELPAVDPGAGVIPTVSLLDTQYLASHGVRFRTLARSAVAVVRQTNSGAAGDRNGISGVYDGEPRSLAPGRRLIISFWVPTNTGLAAVTDQVRLRLDPRELATVVPYLRLFGVNDWIDATLTPGEDPGVLEIRAPGIHSVEYWPTGENPTAPLREISFGPLVSSLDSRRLGPMVFEPLVRVLRERYAELSRLQRPWAQWPRLLERIRIRRAIGALQNPGRTLASQCRALARAQAEMAGYMDNARFDHMFHETTRSLYGQVRFRLRRLYAPVPLYQLLPDDSRIDSARRRFQVAYESLERGEELCIPAPQEHGIPRVLPAKRQAGALAFARAAANVPTLEASTAFIPKLLPVGTLRQIGRLDGHLLVSTTGFNMEGSLTNGTLHFDSVHTTILRPPRPPPPFPFPYPPVPPPLFRQRVQMMVSGITGPGTYYPKAAAVANDNVLCFSAGEGPDLPPCCGGTPPESVDISAEEGYARLDITHVTPEFVAGYYFFSTSCDEFGFATGIFKLPNRPGP